MIAGSQYYVTFDRTYYNFRGGCSYLLASDFLDRNFSIAISYDARITDSHELLLLVNKTVIRLDVINDVRITLRILILKSNNNILLFLFR